ncbi:hypothetical protein AFK68_21320 [Hydrocoleum sp. CS-953]|nr:hypothetical protein AFK68_21320 [Hydrocoleum sp. CS-953]
MELVRYKIFLFVKDWKFIGNSGNTSILLVTGFQPELQITVPHHPQKCCNLYIICPKDAVSIISSYWTDTANECAHLGAGLFHLMVKLIHLKNKPAPTIVLLLDETVRYSLIPNEY